MKYQRITILLSLLLVTSHSLAAPKGMTEMEEAVAKMQITEVLHRWALTHNNDDAEGYAKLFTEDGQLVGPTGRASSVGRAAILAYAKAEVVKLGALGTYADGPYKFGVLRTLIINPIIDVIDKTHAKSFIYSPIVAPDVDANKAPALITMGSYFHEFRKENGKWLITKRQIGSGSMLNMDMIVKLGLAPAPAPKAP